MTDQVTIQKALISVFDKSKLEELCSALKGYPIELYSTGGTAKFMRETCGLEVKAIENVTDFPEMMDGRVKTLHPRVFGGILARRDVDSDLKEANTHKVPLFDLVVGNLYAFHEHLGETPKEQSSFIDIGGPSMIRAAAKNHEAVTVVSSPEDYELFIEELKNNSGATTLSFRKKMAGRTFQRTSAYDGLIASEWAKEDNLPSTLSLSPKEPLRYGENPHQKASWVSQGKKSWNQIQGKPLSYNNLLDTEAALRIPQEFNLPCVAIIKHNNPCGVAIGEKSLKDVFSQALSCDSKSAFGGVVATNTVVDKEAAQAMTSLFLEVVIAKGFDSGAKEIFAKKKNLRLIEWENPTTSSFEVKPALGGWLVQETDLQKAEESNWNCVTQTKVPVSLVQSTSFAWMVCKHVKSNAIVLTKELRTVGIGAGQMSRVDAVEIALNKSSEPLESAVLASDAFFPFRDNIDLLKDKGIKVVIQPGGSIRDEEVIKACDEQGIAMVFTGKRHFRH